MISKEQYEMKSIDKLHYKFPAGQSYDKWQDSTLENDATKGYESFLSCKCELQQKPVATYTFHSWTS